MVKKHGKFPANARVDVDYSTGKPKVKFGYPKGKGSPKKQAYKQHLVGYHTIILLLIFYFMICYIIGGTYIKDAENYPENCSIVWNQGYANVTIITEGYEDWKEYNISVNKYKTFVKGGNITCGDKEYFIKFKKDRGFTYRERFASDNDGGMDNNLYLAFVFSVMYLLGLVFFISNKYLTKFLLSTKWYPKWFPKSQAEGILFKTRKKRYVKFLPKDVEDNIVEIPYFKNVELDYKAEGDFNKYLNKIRIREHRYKNWKKGKVGKEEVEIYKWYCRFVFKQKPKTGYLEVIYQ